MIQDKGIMEYRFIVYILYNMFTYFSTPVSILVSNFVILSLFLSLQAAATGAYL